MSSSVVTEPVPRKRSRLLKSVMNSGFLRVVGMSSLLTGLRILLGIVSTKAIALYAGPAGVAAIGQLQNFIALTGTIASAGIPQGIVKYVAEYREQEERKRSLLAAAMVLTVLCAMVTSVATLLLRRELALDLLNDERLAYLFVFSSFAILLSAIAGVVGSALNGLLMVGRMIIIGMLGTLLSFAMMMGLVISLHAEGAMITTIIAGIIGSSLTLVGTFWLGWMKLRDFAGEVHRADIMRLLSFALMALVSGIATPLALLLIRRSLVDQYGIEQAGYWQSVWRISEIYIQAVTIPLANYYVPRLASTRGDAEVRTVILRGTLLMIPFTVLMALTIYVLRDLIIHVLYTAQFSAMRTLFPFQLIGDVFRVSTAMLSMVMVAKAMTRHYIIADVAFHVLFVALAQAMLPSFGPVGTTYAFAAASFLSFVGMVIFFRRLIWPPR